jgi:hypothetical protein
MPWTSHGKSHGFHALPSVVEIKPQPRWRRCVLPPWLRSPHRGAGRSRWRPGSEWDRTEDI